MWAPLTAAVAAVGLGVVAALWLIGPPLGSGSVGPLEISAKPLPLDRAEPGLAQVGQLRFLGALHLQSNDKRFGGISALLHDAACGRLLAVTDSGSWIILEPSEDGERLVGVGAAWMAPLLDAQGKPAASKSDADAESLMRDGQSVLVWFEQDHRAQRYPGVSACRPESLATPPSDIIRLPRMQGWPDNGGAEATANLGDDWVIVAEAAEAGKGAVQGLVRTQESVFSFSYPVDGDFWPTAADALDAGTLVVLARRFSPLRGVAATLSLARLPTDPDGKPQGTAMVQPLALLAPPLLVDNMEGVAVRSEGNRHFVYLVSDDNFNSVQQTLLMKFEILMPPAPPR
ncbi:esterase-like activity of phytase family protein [Thermaurantiacus sp.]